jgi:hypothetical protein
MAEEPIPLWQQRHYTAAELAEHSLEQSERENE